MTERIGKYTYTTIVTMLIFLPAALLLCPIYDGVSAFTSPTTAVTGAKTGGTPRTTGWISQTHHAPRTHAQPPVVAGRCPAFVLEMAASPSLAPGMAAIDDVNDELEGLLCQIRKKPFFRMYSVDMLASCEYIPQELFECYSSTCEIYPIDEEEIPLDIQSFDKAEHDFQLDGWARWDMPSEDYYDTSQYPEEFTAYDGSEIWRFIHDRIAFQDHEMYTNNAEEHPLPNDEYDSDSWKSDFNKAVSGLHSMISAQVIRGIEKKISASEPFEDDCPWTDPAAEFARRLSPSGDTPLALENLYFTYMLLLSAAHAARDRLLQDCEVGKIDEDAAESLRKVLAYPLLEDEVIDVAWKRLHDHAVRDRASKETLWEARMRTREMFRVMNCVQCNKCRLHGKIATMGLSTAFQLLLGKSGEGGDVRTVHRVELAALMTTLSKFSTAVRYCTEMTNKINGQAA